MRITVTYISPTDTSGSYIRATADNGNGQIWPFDYESTDPMKDAAEKLAGGPVRFVSRSPKQEIYRTPDKRSGG